MIIRIFFLLQEYPAVASGIIKPQSNIMKDLAKNVEEFHAKVLT